MNQPQAEEGSKAGTVGAAYIVGAVVLLAACAIGGYLIGSSSTATRSEARAARISAFRQVRSEAQAAAFNRATAKGSRAGVKAGTARAVKSGRAQGAENGASAAENELASIAAAEAEAEAQERSENCGAPLFVEGYCPTDAEIEQENQAESEADLP